MMLSPHFALAEFAVSDTAVRRGIDNTPPGHVIPALTRTALGLEAVRVRLGTAPIHITSGYRSLPLNRLIGSRDSSQHVLGEAADFICPGFGTPREIVAALRHSGIPFDQLILEFVKKDGTGGWVHVSFTDNPRRMALEIDGQGTRLLA